MRILVVSNLYTPDIQGGYEILCRQVCDELQRRGHEVSVLTSRGGVTGSTGQPGPDVVDGVKVIRTLELLHPFPEAVVEGRAERRELGLRNRQRTVRALEETDPDIVFLWSQLRLTTGPAQGVEESGRPFLYTFNDPHPTGFVPGSFRPTPRGVARWFLDRVVYPDVTNLGLRLAPSTCISRELQRTLAVGGVPTDRCSVLYQGIPIEEFPMKERPGSMSCPVRILYCGQLHPYKGVSTLIEACEQLARVGFALELSVYGDGPVDYRRELEAMVAGGSARVTFHGRVPHSDLPEVYRSHDIFVFPSIWSEPFGLTHLEAMASGTPVVSTPNGGPGEFLKDGENALLFEAGNSAALADALRRLMNDVGLRTGIALAGRRTVEQGFTLSRYVAGLEGLLHDARSAA